MSKRNMQQTGPKQTATPVKEETVDTATETPVEGNTGANEEVTETKAEEPVKVEPSQAPEVKATAPTATAPAAKGASEALVKALNHYVSAMAPNIPMKEAQGVREQKRLRGALINAIVEAETDAQAKTNIVYALDFIAADTSGCFKTANIFRFYDSAQWQVPRERKEAETLLTLLMATANQKTRGAEARKLDWDALTAQFDQRRADVIASRLRVVYGLN